MRGTQKIWLRLLFILIAGICAAQATDLVGNWTGSTTGYVGADGAYNLVENDSIVSLSPSRMTASSQET